MSEQGYNGWTNYETWLVKLWMDNEQATQEYWLEMARDDVTAYDLSQTLQTEYNDMRAELLGQQHTATVWDDLLGAALSAVNWYEIATALIEDAKEIN
jgi:hypothetical protein